MFKCLVWYMVALTKMKLSEETVYRWMDNLSMMLSIDASIHYWHPWFNITHHAQQWIQRGSLRSRWYSRQNSKGDKSDGKAEDGNGAANVSDGWQCRSVAGGELRRETNRRRDEPKRKRRYSEGVILKSTLWNRNLPMTDWKTKVISQLLSIVQ